MKTAPPPSATQGLLFDQPQSGELSIGARRAHSGRIMESIICRGMDLVPGSQDRGEGYSREGYREGYRNLSIKTVKALADIQTIAFSGVMNGVEFNFWLRSSMAALPFIDHLGWMAF